MKTMTCNQLYGACDAPIQGDTPKAMMRASQEHGMEMIAKGDKAHINAMEAMREQHANMTVDDKKAWMEKFHDDFAAAPDDQ